MNGNARSSGYDRVVNDWYVEPRRAIDALLDVEDFSTLPVYDPACGAGNIVDGCRARGLDVIGTDIIQRGGAHHTLDFLADRATRTELHIITNPPYNLAERFIHQGLKCYHQGEAKIAVLVRLAFLEGQGRYERLFKPHPPARIWQFSSRISMPPGGMNIPAKNGSVAFCWIVWDALHKGSPVFGWLP